MFDKEYLFKGTHAAKVIKLTAKFDDSNALFNRNLDVYLMAPIVGFLYQTKADINNEDGKTTKIFPDQLIKNKEDLSFNYQLIMLLDKNNASDINDRLDKAFRYFDTDKAAEDEKLYNQYVLGGVDVLYEKLIENAHEPADYLRNLYDFMDELNTRYCESFDLNNITELCRLAKR